MKINEALFWIGAIASAVIGFIIEPFFLDPRITLFLPIAFAGIVAIIADPLRAVRAGAIAGLIVDLLHGGPLGIYAGSFAVLSYLLARIHRYFLLDHALFRLAVLCAGTALFFPTWFFFGALAGVEGGISIWKFLAIMGLNLVCLAIYGLIQAAKSLRTVRV